MRTPSRLLPRSFYIALVVFVLASVGVGASYARLHKRKSEHVPFLNALEIVDRHLYILGQGKCVGELSIKTELLGQYDIDVEGFLYLALDGLASRVNMKLNATFNSVGQLGGAIIELDTEGARVVMGSTNINPIRVIVSAKGFGQEYKFERELPGPLQLLSNGDGTYRIAYKHYKIPDAQLEHITKQPIFDAIDLEVVDAEGERTCSFPDRGDRPKREQALDLTALRNFMLQFAVRFGGLLPGGTQ